MIDLKSYLNKKVEVVDTNNKKWNGIVDEYNPYDDFDNYQGESIDVRMVDSNQLICFGLTDIKTIKTII